MIYKFKSQAAADVIMMEPHGKQILQLIGKDASAQGIVTVEQIPAAISALEAAVAQEKSNAPRAGDTQDDDGMDAADGIHADTVSLGQRAVPFIDLLRRSAAERRDVVWGV